MFVIREIIYAHPVEGFYYNRIKQLGGKRFLPICSYYLTVLSGWGKPRDTLVGTGGTSTGIRVWYERSDYFWLVIYISSNDRPITWPSADQRSVQLYLHSSIRLYGVQRDASKQKKGINFHFQKVYCSYLSRKIRRPNAQFAKNSKNVSFLCQPHCILVFHGKPPSHNNPHGTVFIQQSASRLHIPVNSPAVSKTDGWLPTSECLPLLPTSASWIQSTLTLFI